MKTGQAEDFWMLFIAACSSYPGHIFSSMMRGEVRCGVLVPLVLASLCAGNVFGSPSRGTAADRPTGTLASAIAKQFYSGSAR